MKVLWLVNRCPNFIREYIDKSNNVTQGWLDRIADKILKSNIEFIVIAPFKDITDCIRVADSKYYLIPEKCVEISNLKKCEHLLEDIIHTEMPDVIHIHGTEFSHSLALINIAEKFGLLSKSIVSIQGLVSFISLHYTAGLPRSVAYSYTFRDVLKGNISADRRKYKKRGEVEKLTLKKAQNVIGRTSWDEACTKIINPHVNYFSCNETLRESFYTGEWNYNNCEKHSIFVSQCSYPIKGFHHVLESLKTIIKNFPDAKLYVAGESPFKTSLLHLDSYHNYLKKIIIKNNLYDHVVFLGALKENEMKERFLKSNVFVLSSSIENSPNSLGEAMLLGVPVVAADVGGVTTMFDHKKDGYIYPFDEPYMIAFYISKVFEAKDNVFKENEIAHAQRTHNLDINFKNLIGIYKKIIEANVI